MRAALEHLADRSDPLIGALDPHQAALRAYRRACHLQYHGQFAEAEAQYMEALEKRRPEHDRRLNELDAEEVSRANLEKMLAVCREQQAKPLCVTCARIVVFAAGETCAQCIKYDVSDAVSAE